MISDVWLQKWTYNLYTDISLSNPLAALWSRRIPNNASTEHYSAYTFYPFKQNIDNINNSKNVIVDNMQQNSHTNKTAIGIYTSILSIPWTIHKNSIHTTLYHNHRRFLVERRYFLCNVGREYFTPCAAWTLSNAVYSLSSITDV